MEPFFVASVVLLFVYFLVAGRKNEISKFNNGTCPNCNQRLKHFDNDSQGGRGYTCNKCDYVVWVSYPSVDRNFIS